MKIDGIRYHQSYEKHRTRLPFKTRRFQPLKQMIVWNNLYRISRREVILSNQCRYWVYF